MKNRNWKQRLIQYIRYDYRLTIWLWLNRKRRFVFFIGRHFDSARRASFIIAALIAGWAVNYFGGINFTQDILSNYLVAAGAMTGGTIAIVFTISIFYSRTPLTSIPLNTLKFSSMIGKRNSFISSSFSLPSHCLVVGYTLVESHLSQKQRAHQ